MAKAVGYFKRLAQALGPDGDVEQALEASRRLANAEATRKALQESVEATSTSCAASQAVPVAVTAQVVPVVVTARPVEAEPELEEALRLSLAEDERERRRRSLEAETLAWGSKQFGEVSCSLDNDELAQACKASLLQSIEEEQLRLLQVPCSGVPSTMGASQTSSSSSLRSVEVSAEGVNRDTVSVEDPNSREKDQKQADEDVCDMVEHTLKAIMESEVIRLRVSWRRDASSDEALQAVVKAVHTGFGTRLETDGEAATQIALRYEDDDGEMCRLTALTLEDCLDISSNMVKLFVERVPLDARADRSVSLEVQDSAEVHAPHETSLSAVMSVDSGHRANKVEAAADVCKGPLCVEEASSSETASTVVTVEARHVAGEAVACDVAEDFGAVLLREEIDKEEAVVASLLVDEVPSREEVTAVPPCHDLESCDDEEAWTLVPSYTEQEVEDEKSPSEQRS